MQIFDNDYLNETEKNSLQPQSLLYLAAANYSGVAPQEIYPKHVYKYFLDADSKICRFRYTSFQDPVADADVLWDDYINCETKTQKNPGTGRYYLSAWLDDDGVEHPVTYGRIPTEIDMRLVGNRMPFFTTSLFMPENGAYFLAWQEDIEYKKMLKQGRIEL